MMEKWIPFILILFMAAIVEAAPKAESKADWLANKKKHIEARGNTYDPAHMSAAFDSIDLDKDGILTAEEFATHKATKKTRKAPERATQAAAVSAAPPQSISGPDAPVDGDSATTSQWNGYTRYNFSFKGHRCFITQPKKALPSKPWVWRAKFPGYHDEIDQILVGRGFHVAHIDCGAMLGSPKARDLWDDFYSYVTETAGLSKRVALEAVSRGGLYAYGWAANNPEKVSCIYGDVPVLDFKSWPGGKGKGTGHAKEWANLHKQYGLTEEQAMDSEDIPLSKLEPLAKAGIPILHVISPVDEVVPAEENTLILEEKYRALGGSVTVLSNQKGKYSCKGHHFPLDDPERYANFIQDNTLQSRPSTEHRRQAAGKDQSLEGRRPNIILVLTDDQGMGDLSCMGNTILKTPHIDALYRKSTRFADFQVSPTCSPTRAAIMSGRFPFEVGVSHTIMQRDRLAPSVVTFPQALQQAGYKTGLFGKWHLGDGEAYLPQNRGFDEVLMHGAGGIGQYSFGDFKENATNKYFDNVLLHNDTIVTTKGFCTDLFFKASLAWIKKQQDAKQPFFAYVSLNAPHGPLIDPDEYKKRFLDEGYNESTAARYGMIENIDDNMGVLMAKLREWNALENTLVIFMTDNGMAMKSIGKKGQTGRLMAWNAGLKGTKDTNWEGGTHVPAFWYWQGVLDEGVDIPALTAHIDLYRTFCSLAGAKIPESTLPPKGRSLLPLLEDPTAEWPDRTLCSHRGRWGGGGRGKKTRALAKYYGASVRTQRWRLVYEMDSEGPWLSDISADPGETKNLINESPEVAEQLKAEFDLWWDASEAFLVNKDLPRIRAGEHHLQKRYNQQLKEMGIPDWEPEQF
jgi:arylsulfatase A-like enzyme/pimeloyl-ACP methyl ester carboxylesterase